MGKTLLILSSVKKEDEGLPVKHLIVEQKELHSFNISHRGWPTLNLWDVLRSKIFWPSKVT